MADTRSARASVVVRRRLRRYQRHRLPRSRSAGDRRDEPGHIRVDEHLRVLGETQTFALGDADREMAGIATAQAGVVAADVRALITGSGEPTRWEPLAALVAILLGPEGGAGVPGDMSSDRYAARFETAPPLAA